MVTLNIGAVSNGIILAIHKDKIERMVEDYCGCESCIEGRAGWFAGIAKVEELVKELVKVTPAQATLMCEELIRFANKVDVHGSYNNSFQYAMLHFIEKGYEANANRIRMMYDIPQPELEYMDPWLGDLNSLWGEE